VAESDGMDLGERTNLLCVQSEKGWNATTRHDLHCVTALLSAQGFVTITSWDKSGVSGDLSWFEKGSTTIDAITDGDESRSMRSILTSYD
jgi:hypothetical protein